LSIQITFQQKDCHRESLEIVDILSYITSFDKDEELYCEIISRNKLLRMPEVRVRFYNSHVK